MRHIWSVVCRYALEDRNSNNVSLIETMTQFSFRGDLPERRPVNVPFRLQIVSLWRRNMPEKDVMYSQKVRLLSPQGVELTAAEGTIDFQSYDTFRMITSLDTIPFTVNGIYEFELSHKPDNSWVPVACIPLEIIHEQPEPEQQESEFTD